MSDEDGSSSKPAAENLQTIYFTYALAMQSAQHALREMIRWAFLLTRTDSGLEEADVVHLARNRDPETVQRVLDAGSRIDSATIELGALFPKVVKHHDRLANRYFLEAADGVRSPEGRESMLKEILESSQLFSDASTTARGFNQRLRTDLDIDEGELNTELSRVIGPDWTGDETGTSNED